MLSNYLKTAFRNLIHNKGYAFINISGLSLGLSASILILLFVQDELNYDKCHLKSERIFRMNSEYHLSGVTKQAATSGYPLGPLLKEEMPFIETYTRLLRTGSQTIIEIGDKQYFEDNLFYGDETHFDILTHEFINGQKEQALSEPNSIVLTRSLSEKYFGKDANPVGQMIKVGSQKTSMKVTAVIEDLPGNVHFPIQGLISMKTIDQYLNAPIAIWSFNVHTLILLKEGADISQLEEAFPAFYEKHMAEIGRTLQSTYKVVPENLRSIHLHSTAEWDFPRGRMANIYIFGIVALFIIVIASINYTNMSTARSEKRSKEVGIRKVLGSTRKDLVYQFLGESALITIVSFLISLACIEFLLPVFNELSGKSFDNESVFQWGNVWIFIVFIVLTSVLSGAYPALFLSSFQPVEVLKNRFGGQGNKGLFRKSLLLFQFTLSMLMMMSTLLVSRQLNYIRNKDIGFNKENTMQMRLSDTTLLGSRSDAFRAALLQLPDIEGVGSASILPGGGHSRNVHVIEGSKGEQINQAINFAFVDLDFLNTMSIEVVRGRNFFKDSEKDLNEAFLVNEAATKSFGWGEEAIGKKIQFGAKVDDEDEQVINGKVIGVVKDYNYNSLHQNIEPLVILPYKDLLPQFIIRLKPGYTQESIGKIQKVFEEFSPSQVFHYSFLDQTLDKLYESETKLSKLTYWFSGLSLFISFMGLVALISFLTEKRKKEFAIRRILGAGMPDILKHIYKDFLWMVLVSFIIACPLSWYGFLIWTSNFAYSAPMSFVPMIIVGMAILLLTLITVTWHAIKTSRINPAEVIAYE